MTEIKMEYRKNTN